MDATAAFGLLSVGSRRELNMRTRNEYKTAYGNDAPWTNVVWTIIGILCAFGLVAYPFIR